MSYLPDRHHIVRACVRTHDERMQTSIHDIAESLRDDLITHARVMYPRECCGVIIRTPSGVEYRRVRNVLDADGGDRFEMHPTDLARAEDDGAVLAIVHSHPDACANPSQADRVMCERTECAWVIVGYPSEAIVTLEPSGYEAPLVGREFHHGTLDCYTLIRDYYGVQLGIELPDFPRNDAWWERGETLYRDGFEAAGFVAVDGDPQAHDVLLMQVATRGVENHGAVFIGDGTILHHLYGRLSGHDVWGGYWQQHTTLVLRHRDMLDGGEAAVA